MEDAIPSGSRRLAWLALLGTLGILALNLVGDLPPAPRQIDGVPVLLISALVVGCLACMPLRRELSLLRNQRALLVPLGLHVLYQGLLGLLALLPVLGALALPSTENSFLFLGLALSPFALASFLGSAVYITWTTVLVVQVARGERADAAGAWKDVKRRILRVSVFALLCVAAVLACLAIVIPFIHSASNATPSVVVVGLASLALSLFTAALLPVAVTWNGSAREAFARGLRLSRKHLGAWAVLLVAQLLVLGLVTHVRVTLGSGSASGWGLPDSGVHHKTANRVNAMWTGGYADESFWLDNLMTELEVAPLASVVLLTSLVLAVLAILIKLRVARVLHEHGEL